MKAMFSYLLFIILLYVFMFAPPLAFLGGVKLSYVLVSLSIFFALLHIKEWISYIKLFRKEVSLFSIVVLISIFRSGLMGDYMYIVRHVLSLLYIVTVIPFMLIISNKLNIQSEKEIVNGILISSSIAGCLSMLCTIVPSFNDYVKSVIIQYQEEDYLFGSINRGFGIASGLTSSFAYIQGTIVAFGLLYIRENKWFLIFIPFVFLSALVNARTGVLLSFWGFLTLIFAQKRSAFFSIVIVSIAFIFYLESIMRTLGFNEYTINWILDFQEQIGNITTGDLNQGTANTMSRMIVWPSSLLEWLLGSGVDLFDLSRNHSDIGWFVQLNYGGLIYVIPLYYVFFEMTKRLLRSRQNAFAIMFIGVAIIVNTKSKIFPTISFAPVLIFLYVLIITKTHTIIQSNNSNRTSVKMNL